MASPRNGGGTGQLIALYDVGTMAGLADGQLLERFVTGSPHAAELAFAALVERHGPMVLRTCRGALRDPHEAEDAFQATFLVLARRAASIRKADTTGCWLHGVALRVARHARASAARRSAHERRKAARSPAAYVETETGADELGRAIHEELQRLPGRLREAAVLVLVQGCGHDEAALRLGRPLATIRSRLAAARARLRDRLTRRGLAPAAGALGTALAAEASGAGVPARLAREAVRLGMGFAAGAMAGEVPAGVAALTRGVLTAMTIQKLKAMAAASVALGLIGASLGWGQAVGPAPGADRLEAVERKLDRLLEVMGDRAPGEASPSAGPDVVKAAPVVRWSVTPAAVPPAAPPRWRADAPAAKSADADGSEDGRLDRLERSVDAMQRRLADQERRLRALERAEVHGDPVATPKGFGPQPARK